jgi:hypothetical protein
MLRPAAAALLVIAASAAAEEETIWLRGRGSDVWIERGDEMREPRDDRKGVSFVSIPARAAADRDGARAWRGGLAGGVPLPSVSGPPPPAVPYGLDGPYLEGMYDMYPPYGLGYDYYPRGGYGYDHYGRHRVRHHRHGRHHFGDGHHRFGSDERRRPEMQRGHAFRDHHRDRRVGGHGGFRWRGAHQRGR